MNSFSIILYSLLHGSPWEIRIQNPDDKWNNYWIEIHTQRKVFSLLEYSIRELGLMVSIVPDEGFILMQSPEIDIYSELIALDKKFRVDV